MIYLLVNGLGASTIGFDSLFFSLFELYPGEDKEILLFEFDEGF